MPDQSADLSVVIPTFNRPALLEATVRSVLAQTVRPREVVVVDNGTDGATAAMLARFGDAVTLIRQPPQGVQVARNTGMAATRSTWIALLDDDDLYRPDLVAAFLAPIADGRADVICCDHRKFEGDHSLERSNFESAPPGYWTGVKPEAAPERAADWSFVDRFPVDRLLHFIPFFPSATAIRRDLFERTGGYDPRLRGVVAEDAEFLARALLAGRLAVVWRALVDYRLHDFNDSGHRSGGYDGQAVGRWRVFESLRANPAVTDPGFRAALEREMPRLRARAYDGAFGTGDFTAARAIGTGLRRRDWTAKRRLKRIVTLLPGGVSGGLRRLGLF